MGRRPVRALSALVLVSTILAAGAASAVAAEGLLTESGRAAYLEARGIDPAEAIVQVGPRLYAGPAAGCPAGFDCVDPAGAPVLQVVTADARGPGIALAKCSGAGGVTSVTTGNDCTVSQVVPASSAPADLTASCTHGSAEQPISDPAATSTLQRTCSITQDNDTGGHNSATVRIYLKQDTKRKGGVGPHVTNQTAVATTDIDQSATGAGTNTADVQLSTSQHIDSIEIPGAIDGTQEGRVATSLEQASDHDNAATITHRIVQKAHAGYDVGGPIVFRQNAADDGKADSYAYVRQNSTSGDPDVGFNNVALDMSETLHGFSVVDQGAITLTQGAPSGGLVGDIDGDADGVPPQGATIDDAPGSSFTAKLKKDFRQLAYSDAGGARVLVQDDVVDCCDLPLGFSDSYDFCDLDFDAIMRQYPTQSQKITMRGTAEVDRACSAAFDGSTNDSSFSEQDSGERIAFNAECRDDACATNEAPTAQDITASGQEDGTVTWTPAVNDPEGGTMTCEQWVDDPPLAQHGTVSVDPDCGQSTYTPDPDFAGTDTFRYVAKDPGGLFSNRATVTITVTEVNDAPVAGDDEAETDEDVPVTIAVAGNDSDVDDGLDLSSVSVVGPVSGGDAVVNPGGTVTFTPQPDLNGTGSFIYEICDHGDLCDEADVTVTILPVNDAPVAVDDVADTDEDTAVSIPVATNDSDIDDGIDTASVSVVVDPAHGTAVANVDGSVTYTPSLDYDGMDSFSYGICDHGGLCDTATVTVTVHNVPTPPDSSLVLGVRNERTGGAFGTSTNLGIAPDNRAQYKITYRNDGEASATGVIVRHPIPNQASLASGSCSPSCTVQGGQVVFNLGTRPTGATDLFFTLVYSVSFQNTTTQATGQSIEEGAFPPSNPVIVRNICISTPTSPLCDPF